MTALSGRVALVTGSSRGIGRAVAQRLARDGAAVAVHYRTRVDEAAAVVEHIAAAGGTARAFGSDVAAGTLSFRYAAAVSDPFEDFAQTSSFLGDDMAPDTLVDGDGYTFDLATDGCLVMEEAVTGTADLFAPTAGLNFPPNAVAKTQLKNVCTDLEGAIDTGLLSVYRANKPDHAGWQTREVRIVADSSAIYLPYVSSLHVLEGHDVPTATPEPTSDAPPTEVPTADPSHPTSQPSVEPGPPTDEPRAPTAAP